MTLFDTVTLYVYVMASSPKSLTRKKKVAGQPVRACPPIIPVHDSSQIADNHMCICIGLHSLDAHVYFGTVLLEHLLR